MTGCGDLLNVSLRLVLSGWSVARIQSAAELLNQNRELGFIHFYAELFCNRNPVAVFASRDQWGTSVLQGPPYAGA